MGRKKGDTMALRTQGLFGKAILEKDPPLATIWLNRPEKRNNLSLELAIDLFMGLGSAEVDDDIKVIAVRGKGGNFCAGADLTQITRYQRGTATGEGKEEGGSMFPEQFQMVAEAMSGWLGKGGISNSLEYLLMSGIAFNLIERMGKKPTIAVIEGFCIAGGFELMLALDFAIAAEDAKIADFHIRHGLMGGAGPLYRLPRYVGLRKAKEIILTGKFIPAKEAEQMGLVNRVVPAEKLDESLKEFVDDLTLNLNPVDERVPEKSPLIMRIMKLLLDRSMEADKDTLQMLEAFGDTVIFQTEDSQEAVKAFLEKRKANIKGM